MRFVYAVMSIKDYERSATPAKVFATVEAALNDFTKCHPYEDNQYTLVKIKINILIPAKNKQLPIFTFRLLGEPLTIKQYIGAPFSSLCQEVGSSTETIDLFLSILPSRNLALNKLSFANDVNYLSRLNQFFPNNVVGIQQKYLFLQGLLQEEYFVSVLRERREISCHYLNQIVNPYEEQSPTVAQSLKQYEEYQKQCEENFKTELRHMLREEAEIDKMNAMRRERRRQLRQSQQLLQHKDRLNQNKYGLTLFAHRCESSGASPASASSSLECSSSTTPRVG